MNLIIVELKKYRTSSIVLRRFIFSFHEIRVQIVIEVIRLYSNNSVKLLLLWHFNSYKYDTHKGISIKQS